MRIFKYPIPITDTAEVRMPAGATLLSIQEQAGVVCLWALVSPTNPKVTRHIQIVGTGHPIDRMLGTFIATVQTDGGRLVWHMFDAGETK